MSLAQHSCLSRSGHGVAGEAMSVRLLPTGWESNTDRVNPEVAAWNIGMSDHSPSSLHHSDLSRPFPRPPKPLGGQLALLALANHSTCAL